MLRIVILQLTIRGNRMKTKQFLKTNPIYRIPQSFINNADSDKRRKKVSFEVIEKEDVIVIKKLKGVQNGELAETPSNGTI